MEGSCEETITQFLADWDRRKRMAIVQLVCHVVYMIYLMDYYSSYMDKRLKNISGERDNVRKELIEQISTNKKCHDIIRMSPLAFARLCELL